MKSAVKNPETFLGRLKMSFSLMFNDPVVYIVYPAVFLAIVALVFMAPVEWLFLQLEDPEFVLDLAKQPMAFFLKLLPIGILGLFFSVLVFLFTSLALIRYTAQKQAGKKPKLATIISDLRFAVKDYIVLGFRVFWYLLWPLILYIVFLLGIVWLFLTSGIVAVSSGQIVVDALEVMPGYETLWTFMTFALGFGGLFVLLILFYRSFQMMLAFPAFAADNKNAKDSFNESLKLTKNYLLVTFGQLFCVELIWSGIVFVIAMLVYGLIELILPVGAMQDVIRVFENGDEMFIASKPLGAILQLIEALIGSLTIGGVAVFTALFYESRQAELKSEKKE